MRARVRLRGVHYVGLLAVLSVVVTIATTLALLWQLRGRALEHARLETASLGRMLVEHTDQIYASVDQVLRGVEGLVASPFGRQLALASATTHRLLEGRATALRQITAIYLIDARGQLVNSSWQVATPRHGLVDEASLAWFADPGRDDLFVAGPRREPVTGNWTIVLARPLRASGRLEGVVLATLDLPSIEQAYWTARIEYERPVALLGLDARAIVALPQGSFAIGAVAPTLATEAATLVPNVQRSFEHASGDGSFARFSLGRSGKYPFVVAVQDDELMSLSDWRETATPIALGALGVCLFILGAALWLVQKASRAEALEHAVIARLRASETELREVNQELRQLAASLQQVREQERTRVAGELHDDLGQQLTGIKLSLSWLANGLSKGRLASAAALDEPRTMLDRVISSLRRLASELRSLAPDEDAPFVDALARLVKGYTQHSGLEVELQLDAADQVRASAVRLALYRIVQESLTNLVRHAAATRATISLLEAGAELVLTVADDGVGMCEGRKGQGVGLLSMRERALLIGARFDLEFPPAGGTSVSVRVPLGVARGAAADAVAPEQSEQSDNPEEKAA